VSSSTNRRRKSLFHPPSISIGRRASVFGAYRSIGFPGHSIHLSHTSAGPDDLVSLAECARLHFGDVFAGYLAVFDLPNGDTKKIRGDREVQRSKDLDG
jgi:hypothetical protein